METSVPRKRVLIVDDNKHLLVTLGDYLTFEGYEVTTALSAEEALRKLDKSSTDLIILDIAMPGMGGIGFLKRIAGEDGKPRYPVLVLTARPRMEEFFSAVEVDGFLSKPCTETALVHKIREILEARGSAPQPAEPTRRCILLVENKHRAARDTAAVFEAAGFDVEIVSSGAEALDRASASRPHVIVIKELLPKMSGSTVCSMLKAMPGIRTIPVVLYDATRALESVRGYSYTEPAGVDKVVTTSEPAVILGVVRELLQS